MQTEILSSLDLDRAAEILLEGEVVAFPTETVYGLGACIYKEEAVRKIFQAKGRPSDNPLIAHVSDLEQLLSIAENISPDFYPLYEAFFPGPLTVVLPKKAHVPSLISGGLPTVAVRMPRHGIAHELIKRVDEPLVAPSANLSGKPSSTHYHHVLSDFQGKIAAVIKDQESEIGLESTVLSLLGPKPVLLRPGHITKEQIETVLKKSIEVAANKQTKGPALSPGMKYRHYAPNASVHLFYQRKELDLHLESGSAVKRMLLSFHPLNIKGCENFLLSSKTLYAALRFADQKGFDEILVLCESEILQDMALMNRLSRSAEKSIQEEETCELLS